MLKKSHTETKGADEPIFDEFFLMGTNKNHPKV